MRFCKEQRAMGINKDGALKAILICFFLGLFWLIFSNAEASEPEPSMESIYSSYDLTHLPQANNLAIKLLILIPLFSILFILGVYVIRHYFLALNRLFGKQNNFYAEIIEANWPGVTILVPAHNEENVINDLLEGVLKIDYPTKLLQVIIVNDRSTDSTGEIVESYVSQYPHLFTHFNRQEGKPGKSAALLDLLHNLPKARPWGAMEQANRLKAEPLMAVPLRPWEYAACRAYPFSRQRQAGSLQPGS